MSVSHKISFTVPTTPGSRRHYALKGGDVCRRGTAERVRDEVTGETGRKKRQRVHLCDTQQEMVSTVTRLVGRNTPRGTDRVTEDLKDLPL